MRTWPGSAGEKSETARLSVLKMRKLMSNRKKWQSTKAAWALRTHGRQFRQRRYNGSKKASAHGAGGTFQCTENRKWLRYNDQSVYPRAKACGALFESA
jgi:hypothetical protein